MMKKMFLLVLLLVSVAEAQQFPDPPLNVSASDGISNTQVSVSWQAPSSGGPITNYLVYRSTLNEFCPGTAIATVSTTSYTDTTVNPTTIYYYSVRANGPAGSGNCSSTDSGYADSLNPPLAPENVSATTNRLDKVVITWTLPPSSEPRENLEIFRAPSRSFCVGQPLATVAEGTLFFDDLTATAGQQYFYSLRSTGPTGISNCSEIDDGIKLLPPPPLPPSNVDASDGTFEDKIRVSWQAPTGGEAFTNYVLHRSQTPGQLCNAPLVTNIASGASSFDDTQNVTPGVRYYYSMQTTGPTGQSLCSNLDPGHAKVAAPAVISATDGTFEDRVVVTWQVPPGEGVIQGYELFRDLDGAQPCSTLLVDGVNATIYEDFKVTPAVSYYYSVQAKSPAGDGSCSPIDPGFARPPVTVCSDGLDNDSDGLIDLADPGCLGDPNRDTEKNPDGPECDDGLDNDGDGRIDYRVDGQGDLGCESPRDPEEENGGEALKSPAFAKFNTFLGQFVFAELVNQGDQDKPVDLTVFNLFGEVMIERTYVVPANSQVDVDINSLVQFACDVLQNACDGFEDLSATEGAENGLGRPDGVVDTYGLVRLDFEESEIDRIQGRMSFYRRNVDGSFSFAFSRELRNPSTGITYATSNTFDPQGQGFLVPNWAEVINFGKRDSQGRFIEMSQRFTVNIYNQAGILVSSEEVSIPALGEFDIQAGHEFVDSSGKPIEAVYLVEVIPEEPDAEYFLSVSRYSSNSPPNSDPSSYNYAFTVEGAPGTTESLFAPVANAVLGVQGLAGKTFIDNWVEVVCVSNEVCGLEIVVRRADGTEALRRNDSFAPKSQYHINASALLEADSDGSVEIRGTRPIVLQSMSYVHGTGLEAGFSIAGRTKGRGVQAGSINTFIGMQNTLTAISTQDDPVDAGYLIKFFGGETLSGVFSFGAGALSTLDISQGNTINVPSDTYGAISLSTPFQGEALYDVRRIRIVDGEVDFVMPTMIQ